MLPKFAGSLCSNFTSPFCLLSIKSKKACTCCGLVSPQISENSPFSGSSRGWCIVDWMSSMEGCSKSFSKAEWSSIICSSPIKSALPSIWLTFFFYCFLWYSSMHLSSYLSIASNFLITSMKASFFSLIAGTIWVSSVILVLSTFSVTMLSSHSSYFRPSCSALPLFFLVGSIKSWEVIPKISWSLLRM